MKTRYKVLNRCPIGAVIRKDYIDSFGYIAKSEKMKLVNESWFWYDYMFRDSGLSYSTMKARLQQLGFKDRLVYFNGQRLEIIEV